MKYETVTFGEVPLNSYFWFEDYKWQKVNDELAIYANEHRKASAFVKRPQWGFYEVLQYTDVQVEA